MADLRQAAGRLRTQLRPSDRPRTAPEENGERLATIPRSEGEELRLNWSEYNGHHFLNLRIWAQGDDGAWWPQKDKGLTVRVSVQSSAFQLSTRIYDEFGGCVATHLSEVLDEALSHILGELCICCRWGWNQDPHGQASGHSNSANDASRKFQRFGHSAPSWLEACERCSHYTASGATGLRGGGGRCAGPRRHQVSPGGLPGPPGAPAFRRFTLEGHPPEETGKRQYAPGARR